MAFSVFPVNVFSSAVRRAIRRYSRTLSVSGRRTKLLPARLSTCHTLSLAAVLSLTAVLYVVRLASTQPEEPFSVFNRQRLLGSNSISSLTTPFAPATDTSPPLLTALGPLRNHVDAIVANGAAPHHALVHVYMLPPHVVAHMAPSLAATLYWKLVYTDVITALHSGTSGPVFEARARVLFIHTQNGLGNRLRALASGLAIARATQRVPVVVWEKDPHLGADIAEIFSTSANGSDIDTVLYKDLVVMHSFAEWRTVAAANCTWHGVSYMEKDGLGAEPSVVMHFQMPNRTVDASESMRVARDVKVSDTKVQLTARHVELHDGDARLNSNGGLIHVGKHVYFKSAYVANTEPDELSTRSVVNHELRQLRPSAAVMQIVDSLDGGALRNAIGVHIRSRSLAHDNVDVRTRCEYTRAGARVTDYWRSRSSVAVFVKKMRWAIRREKHVRFFVATDDVAVLRSLRKRFGERIMWIERGCDDRREGCVKFAMADLMCLARTRKIYGSNWSSFSEAAGRLGNKSVYLSGYHFGRRRGLRRRWDRVYMGVGRVFDSVMWWWPSWLTLPWKRCA
ncbi:hypothetical protein BWQ96_04546 [Gracilariopsis chorda]|uniref:Uncharacterized protein n=1 Tax=Gracilariopsis chorda TaxID=448386 RepID=A0A2V3IU55_9FLOR|nr:hypothetical protein BWQ96_04546 [Gracilariopsis chorda]|eukprot:PXF45642.1 hypothetical protein BWQ96_04546 [Gracilariopsis chorda]